MDREAGWRHSSKKPLDLKVKDRGLLYRHDDLPNMNLNTGALTSGQRNTHMLSSVASSPRGEKITIGEEESLFKT